MRSSAIHGGHALQPPVRGVLRDQAVDLRLLQVDPQQSCGPPVRQDRRPAKMCAELARSLVADIGLKQHLHCQFAGLAAMARGQAGPPCSSFRLKLTISIAATAASNPLLPPLMPARSRACSQGFAGEHAKGVGHAGLLLRLADAARHFVVDGFVVSRLTAQQATQSDHRIRAAAGSACRPRRRLPHRGHARSEYRSGRRRCASDRPENSIEQAIGNNGVQRATTTANFMPAAVESPLRPTACS